MKTKLIIVSFLMFILVTSVLGQDIILLYKIEKNELTFIKRGDVVVSKNCFKLKNIDCPSLIKIKKEANLKDILDKSENGVNPGAMVCNHLQGKVILATDFAGNQVTFCYFAGDEVYISSETLSVYAKKNYWKVDSTSSLKVL